MLGHFNDVKKLMNDGISSDSFAKHFGTHFCSSPSNDEFRRLFEFGIIWQGNPISLTKTFSKRNCQLCLKEKVTIVSQSRKKETILNSCSEIYGACRHKTAFHRFCTDECPDGHERVPPSPEKTPQSRSTGKKLNRDRMSSRKKLLGLHSAQKLNFSNLKVNLGNLPMTGYLRVIAV